MTSNEERKDGEGILDPGQLTMIAEAGGDDPGAIFHELLELFISESQQRLAEVKAHRDEAEYELMGRSAHALAGSSANIGGIELWRLGKSIENLCKEGKGDDAGGMVGDLESLYEDTVSALTSYGQQLGPGNG